MVRVSALAVKSPKVVALKHFAFTKFGLFSVCVAVYMNENRFDSVFSKDNYQKENFGDFIKAYVQDVIEDDIEDIQTTFNDDITNIGFELGLELEEEENNGEI